MIVFNHQEVRQVPENAAEFQSPGRCQRRASGILRARRDDNGAHAAAARGFERSRHGTLIVNREWHGHQAVRRQEIQHARERRVLDGDTVAGAHMLAQHAFDRVETAAGDGERFRRDAIGFELSGHERGQGGQ